MSDSSALDAIFQSKDLDQALQLMRQFDASPYDKIRAIFDSVVSAKNLSIESRSESLDLVAGADMLLERLTGNSRGGCCGTLTDTLLLRC